MCWLLEVATKCCCCQPRRPDSCWLSHCAPPLLQTKADAMVKHLASLADQRLIISFAPKTLAYTILKRIGELFPGPSKVQHHVHALLLMCRLTSHRIWHHIWPCDQCFKIQSSGKSMPHPGMVHCVLPLLSYLRCLSLVITLVCRLLGPISMLRLMSRRL